MNSAKDGRRLLTYLETNRKLIHNCIDLHRFLQIFINFGALGDHHNRVIIECILFGGLTNCVHYGVKMHFLSVEGEEENN